MPSTVNHDVSMMGASPFNVCYRAGGLSHHSPPVPCPSPPPPPPSNSLPFFGSPFTLRTQASRITAEDFPKGRLHNLIIAPKRSGDRGRRVSTSYAPNERPLVSPAASVSSVTSASFSMPDGSAGSEVRGRATKAGRPNNEPHRGGSVPPAMRTSETDGPGCCRARTG